MIKLIIKAELNTLMYYIKGASRTMPNVFIYSLVFPGGCCAVTLQVLCAVYCAYKNIIVPRIIISCNYLVRLKDRRKLEIHSCCAHFIARVQILLCYVKISCGIIWYVQMTDVG